MPTNRGERRMTAIAIRQLRTDHRPLRVVLALVFEDHADGPLPDFCWIPLRCVVHDSILSKVGASRRARAVQLDPCPE